MYHSIFLSLLAMVTLTNGNEKITHDLVVKGAFCHENLKYDYNNIQIYGLDLCKLHCLDKRENADQRIQGYWFKLYNGGYCGCCVGIDLDDPYNKIDSSWPDASIYRLGSIENEQNDETNEESGSKESVADCENGDSLLQLPQAPTVQIKESSEYSSDYNIQALQAHNTYRRAHQVSDMEFDADIAASAQKWAEKMNGEGRMAHSGREERPGCGENLAMNSNVQVLVSTPIATKMWYNEVTNPGYDFNNQGFSSGTGHFTQVVWKSSTKLGCGVSGVYVVCRYCQSAGNYQGQFENNVFPKGAEVKCEGQKASEVTEEQVQLYEMKKEKFVLDKEAWEKENARLKELYEANYQKNAEARALLASQFGESTGRRMGGCCSACNRYRRRCGQRPVNLDVPTCQRAQSFFDDKVCTKDGGRTTCRTKQGTDIDDLVGDKTAQGRRRFLEETGESPECHQSIWKNPDESTPLTSEAAMQAWYDQSIYFDYETGLPVEGKQKEAFEFINVINTETTQVGFGISDPYVIGYYCPSANTDPEALKKNTPRERVPPVAPTLTGSSGTEDSSTTLILTGPLQEGELCPEIDESGARPECEIGLCCGLSSKASDSTQTIEHCKLADVLSYENSGEPYTWYFECYQSGNRLLTSSGVIIASMYAIMF